jgi:hypothetical protein
MIKKITLITAAVLTIGIITLEAGAEKSSNPINRIKLSGNDLPSGFMFGKVPGFARRVLKNNPWMMDRGAIKKLTPRIYPGGDYNRIKGMHMTIMSKKKNPYGDDIVCYIILYRDSSSAQEELKKISSFAQYNKDRVIVLSKGKLAVYLHVDDTENFHHIENMAEQMRQKMLSI